MKEDRLGYHYPQNMLEFMLALDLYSDDVKVEDVEKQQLYKLHSERNADWSLVKQQLQHIYDTEHDQTSSRTNMRSRTEFVPTN